MTLQERQQREIKSLNREIEEMRDDIKKLCHGDLIGLYDALHQVTNSPEEYFRKIDEEENKLSI